MSNKITISMLKGVLCMTHCFDHIDYIEHRTQIPIYVKPIEEAFDRLLIAARMDELRKA